MPKENTSGTAGWSVATVALLIGAGRTGARSDASAILLPVGVWQGVALTIPVLQDTALTRLVGVLQGVALT